MSARRTRAEKGSPAAPERHHRIAAYRVELVVERRFAFPRRPCRGADDAVALFRKYVGTPDREYVVVLCLDARQRFVGVHTAGIGTLTRSEVHAREIFKAAILGNAHEIILAHNHPSGDPAPNAVDVEITRGLELVGELIGIPLLDHVIVGATTHVSMRECGLMEAGRGRAVPVARFAEEESGPAGRLQKDPDGG